MHDTLGLTEHKDFQKKYPVNLYDAMQTQCGTHWLHKKECTFHSLSMGGAHSRVKAYIASPTSPLHVGKHLTALLHTQ